MINLIPTEAKKGLIREYWFRSVTAWFFLWTFVLVLGIVLLIPSYVLLNLQVSAYSKTAEIADEKNSSFDAVAKELERASKTAASLSEHLSKPSITVYIELLKSFETNTISVTQVSLERDVDEIGHIKMTGIAADRQELAAFRNRMLEDDRIETVDLPISNLAKDKQIPFELTIAIAKEKKS